MEPHHDSEDKRDLGEGDAQESEGRGGHAPGREDNAREDEREIRKQVEDAHEQCDGKEPRRALVQGAIEDAGPSPGEVAQGRVHAGGRHVEPVGQSEAVSFALDETREGDVFEKDGLDALVSADGAIDRGAHHDELAVGEGAGRAGVVDPAEREAEEEDGPGEHAQGLLPEAPAVEPKDEAEHVEALGEEVRCDDGESAGVECDVGVEEEEEVASGDGGGLAEGVVLAGPAPGEFADLDEPEARVLRGEVAEDAGRVVVGAVVGDDDLEGGVVLGEKGAQGAGDVGGFIAGRDEDGDEGRRARRGSGGVSRETRLLAERPRDLAVTPDPDRQDKQPHDDEKRGQFLRPSGLPFA